MASAAVRLTNLRVNKSPLRELFVGKKCFIVRVSFADARYDQSSRPDIYSADTVATRLNAACDLTRVDQVLAFKDGSSDQNIATGQITGDAKLQYTASTGKLKLLNLGMSGAGGGNMSPIDEVEITTNTNAVTGPLLSVSTVSMAFDSLFVGT